MNRRPLFPPLFLFLILNLINEVHATEESASVDLTHLPDQVANALGIPVFAAGILCFVVMTFALMLPAMIWGKKGSMASLFIGIGVLGFGIAVAWLPFWFLLIIILIIAVMFAEDVRNMITGGF
ncbi:hypothetical protein MUP46_03740 [Patescibacteria group bacterium]|nr:hypothetical protein [Patescibacteria group bacterium]